MTAAMGVGTVTDGQLAARPGARRLVVHVAAPGAGVSAPGWEGGGRAVASPELGRVDGDAGRHLTAP